MSSFDRRKTKPLGFDEMALEKYVNYHKGKNQHIDDFIRLTPEQKRIVLKVPLDIVLKYNLVSQMTIEEFAYYFSREFNANKRDDGNTIFDRLSKNTITFEKWIPWPKGNALVDVEPKICYTEGYYPIILRKKFVGAVYQIELENQFPQIIPTEKIFMNNHKIKNFYQYIKDEINAKLRRDQKDPDFSAIDYYGPKNSETTTITSIPEIILLNYVIGELYFSKNIFSRPPTHQNYISPKASSAKVVRNLKNLK